MSAAVPDGGQIAVAWLGRVEYRAAWALQRGLAEARRQGLAPDTLLLVEHPHTFTLGRRGTPDHILLSEAERRRRQVSVVPIDRGGDVTYHGPGQVVAYPILHLGRWGGDVLRYVRMLEEVGIRAAAAFGVRAGREQGLTGVWVGREKLVAIGVRVSGWVTTHGLALNVAPDLSYFEDIVPCGLAERGATSLAKLLGRPPAQGEAVAALVDAFAAVFDLAPDRLPVEAVRSLALPAPPEPSPSARQLGRQVA